MPLTKRSAARLKKRQIEELGEDGYSEMMRQRAAKRSKQSYLEGAKKANQTKLNKDPRHFERISSLPRGKREK